MTALVTIGDVAKFLNVSVITVRRKVNAGELPAIRLLLALPQKKLA
jgi:excisionase family DNA binding protein